MTYSQDYHRYLKVPFDPIKPKLFYTQPDKTLEGRSVNFDYRIKPWLNQFGIEANYHETFYTAPHDKLPIHLDAPAIFDNHVKINFTWSSDESVMRWWKIKDKKKLRYRESNDYHTHKTFYANEDDCDMQFQQVINKPSLVNVGCFHSTYNPSNEGRWTLCIVPLINKKVIKWNDAIEIFKKVII